MLRRYLLTQQTFAQHFTNKGNEIEELLENPDVSSARNYLSNQNGGDFSLENLENLEYIPNKDRFNRVQFVMGLADNNVQNYNLLLAMDVIDFFNYYVIRTLQNYISIVNSKAKKDEPDNAGYA